MIVLIPDEVVDTIHQISALRRYPGCKTVKDMEKCNDEATRLQAHVGDIVTSIVLLEQYGTLNSNHS